MTFRRSSSQRRWALTLAACMLGGGASAATPGTAGASPSPSVSLPGAVGRLGLQLPVGTSRVYRVRSSGSFEVDYGLLANSLRSSLGAGADRGTDSASRRQKSDYALSATLHTRVVAADRSGYLLSGRLQDVDYRVNGDADDRREMLELPFLLKLDRSGEVRGFTFRNRYPEVLAQAIRGLVEPMQVVFSDAALDGWKVREQGADASWDATYARTGTDASRGVAKLSRTKSGYVTSPAGLQGLSLPGKVNARVGKAEASLEVSLAGLGVERVDAVEELSTFAGSTFISSHAGTFHAERVDAKLAQLPQTAAAASAELADTSFARARFYDVQPQVVPEVQGRDVPAIVHAYDAALRTNSAVAHRLLKNYLRMYPAKALEVARALDVLATDDTDRAVGFGFAAFASAGHVEAQRVLVKVLSEQGWKALSREKALVAMMELEMPESFVLQAVWTYRSGLDSTRDAGAALMQSMATNVYGALGDVKKGNPATTAEVVRNLGRLLSSPDTRQQEFALDALTNVGDYASVAPLAAPMFTSRNEDVRARAFTTFRRMEGVEAFPAFEQRYAKETSTEVKREALRAVFGMQPSDARNAFAVRAVATETDVEALSLLVRILGNDMKAHPENEAVLRTLLETQQDRRVRKDIYAFVSPAQKGGK